MQDAESAWCVLAWYRLEVSNPGPQEPLSCSFSNYAYHPRCWLPEASVFSQSEV